MSFAILKLETSTFSSSRQIKFKVAPLMGAIKLSSLSEVNFRCRCNLPWRRFVSALRSLPALVIEPN